METPRARGLSTGEESWCCSSEELFIYNSPDFGRHPAVTFLKDIRPDVGWLFGDFGFAFAIVIIVISASQAVNLTDGLNGLAIGPTVW